MADAPEHPAIAETQQQFLARAILTRGDHEDVTPPWTDADEARLRALADGTGY